MKIKIVILLFIFVQLGCEKNNNKQINKEDLFGKWVNLSENKDTLHFTDSMIFRTHFGIPSLSLSHRYKYQIIDTDKLELFYNGFDKVYFNHPFIHKILLNSEKNILEIQDFHNTYPCYYGDKFIKQ